MDMTITVLGKPGAGKGTQAELIADKYDMEYISTGEMLRNRTEPVTYKAEDGSIKEENPHDYIDGGELVPDPMIVSILESRLDQLDDSRGVVLDGFPRSVDQAKYMEESDHSLDMALYLKVSDSTVKQRLAKRRTCTGCGETYHMEENPPGDNMNCLDCNSDVEQRPDDTPDTLDERLEIYRQTTKPLIDYYQQKGILEAVDGNQQISDVWNNVRHIMESRQ